MTDAVLDSSAVLAHLLSEPGGDIAIAAAATGVISAANHAEVITKLMARGMGETVANVVAGNLELEVVVADQRQAELAGALHARTRSFGISMGDAFCLVLAETLGAPVLTTDRRMAEVDIGVEVRLIR